MNKKTSIAQPPEMVTWGGGVYWERSKDPFHPEAFSAIDEVFSLFSRKEKKVPRSSGWDLIDWAGNVIGFIPDGSECGDDGYEYLLRESYPGRLCAVPNNPNFTEIFDQHMVGIREKT